jgi:quercetin dioxygenase-like cupin family protein
VDRAALVDRLRTSGLDPSPWSNGPGDTYAAHHHGYDKVLVVASGSIEFMTPGRTVALVAGDRLDLPAGTDHAAVVGTEGVTCLESHLPAGSLAGLRRTGDGAW